MRILLVIFILLTLNGCAPKKPTPVAGRRYHITDDAAPHKHERVPNLSKIPNAKPKPEPKSRIGNKSYTVFNKTYSVLPTSKGYKQRGKASWYGKKFHGYKTSNGEVYDMYGMTAAHKTLPLPTYAKVTNLKNGQSIIVRINDRGPFHGDRVIDLSYAAAGKLGILQNGTADVEVHAIDTPITIPESYLQIGAFSNRENAKRLADKLSKIAKDHKVTIRKDRLYHVHIGPIYDDLVMTQLKQDVIKNKLPVPIEVQLGSK